MPRTALTLLLLFLFPLSESHACCVASHSRLIFLGEKDTQLYFLELDLHRYETEDVCMGLEWRAEYALRVMAADGSIRETKPLGKTSFKNAAYTEAIEKLVTHWRAPLGIDCSGNACTPVVLDDCGYQKNCFGFAQEVRKGKGLFFMYTDDAGKVHEWEATPSKEVVRYYFSRWMDEGETPPKSWREAKPDKYDDLCDSFYFGNVRRYVLPGKTIIVAHFAKGHMQFATTAEPRRIADRQECSTANSRYYEGIIHHGTGFDDVFVLENP